MANQVRLPAGPLLSKSRYGAGPCDIRVRLSQGISLPQHLVECFQIKNVG